MSFESENRANVQPIIFGEIEEKIEIEEKAIFWRKKIVETD